MRTRIFLVRHGESEWNIEPRRVQGHSDIPGLTAKGMNQAEKLKKSLEKERIEVIYSSPLKRARQTAEILTDRKIIFDKRLRERGYGEFEGMLLEKMKKIPELYETRKKHGYWGNYETLEPIEEFQRNVFKMFEEVVSKNQGKNVLIVSHGGVIKVILLKLLGMGLEHYKEIEQKNCCINEICIEENNIKVKSINEITHLRGLI